MSNEDFAISVKLDGIDKIIKRHGLDKDGEIIGKIRDEVARQSDPYVPMQIGGHGTLKAGIRYPNNHSIKYIAPYARYQYYGKVMVGSPPKKVTNKNLKYSGAPKRGARWTTRMWADKGESILKKIEKYINGGN